MVATYIFSSKSEITVVGWESLGTPSLDVAIFFTMLLGWRYPKQGVALDYDGWVKLGYTDPIGDFASALAALVLDKGMGKRK